MTVSEDDAWGAGDPIKWSDHGSVVVGNRRHPLIYGEHPHSRSDNRHYVKMGDGEPVGFDGHRILISVTLESRNYLKDSHLSGSEVRKGGSGKIIADGVVVFEFFFRDISYALRKADHLITELMEHPSGWMSKDQRDALVGRAIYYREVPAVIQRVILDQGCLIVRTADGKPFPSPVYHDPDEDGDDDERGAEAKVEVTDHNIWWFRKTKTAP